MPTISVFFGIVIKMFYDEHNPPHFHAEHQGEKAVFDFRGNILRGDISSRTEWVDLHQDELGENWTEMQAGREFHKIDPLK